MTHNYIVRPAIVAATVLSAVAIVIGFLGSRWSLAALPFIWLGSICAQPNLNAADGCLTFLSILIGFAVSLFFRPLGIAICTGAVTGFYISALEKRIRLRPAHDP